VDVFLTWNAPKGQREVRAETMLKDIRTGKCLPSTHWVFVGSSVDMRGKYAADESGSIMTNYHDRLAVLDNPLETGRVDDFTHANAAVIPALGTRVEVRIVPVSVVTGGKPDAE
jgi:hypothetical protein